jgi:carbon storage regulator CsrA
VGEAIAIGNGIEIEILEIGPSKVKLGIHAALDIPVQRKEMMRASQQNRQAAALTVQARTALAKNLSELFSKLPAVGTDKNFEARYSGHPLKKENLGPA